MEQVNINEIFTWAKKKKICWRIGILSFARTFGDEYGKKLMNTATKTGTDAAKTGSKRVIRKNAEATGDLK